MATTKVTNRVLEVDSVGTAQLSAGAITEAKIASSAITNVKLATEVQQLLVPVGAVMAFARNTAPAGWIICDGSSLSTSVYSTLFAAIQYAHGGSGNNFNIPDLRGIFIRGSGSSTIASTTYTGTFASRQGDVFKQHTHGINDPGHFHLLMNSSGTAYLYGGQTNIAAWNNLVMGSINSSGGALRTDARVTGISVQNQGDPTETRPANIALLYCIKWN